MSIRGCDVDKGRRLFDFSPPKCGVYWRAAFKRGNTVYIFLNYTEKYGKETGNPPGNLCLLLPIMQGIHYYSARSKNHSTIEKPCLYAILPFTWFWEYRLPDHDTDGFQAESSFQSSYLFQNFNDQMVKLSPLLRI